MGSNLGNSEQPKPGCASLVTATLGVRPCSSNVVDLVRTFEKVKVKTNVGGSDKRNRRKARRAAASAALAQPSTSLALKKGSVGQTLGDWTGMAIRAPLRGTSKPPSNAPKPRLDSRRLSPRGERLPSLQPRGQEPPAPHPMIPCVWLSDHAPIPNKWTGCNWSAKLRAGNIRKPTCSWLSPGGPNQRGLHGGTADREPSMQKAQGTRYKYISYPRTVGLPRQDKKYWPSRRIAILLHCTLLPGFCHRGLVAVKIKAVDNTKGKTSDVIVGSAYFPYETENPLREVASLIDPARSGDCPPVGLRRKLPPHIVGKTRREPKRGSVPTYFTPLAQTIVDLTLCSSGLTGSISDWHVSWKKR
ncbi:hypothetical protein JTB14_021934 [Gonioctena quinquepunctata]|nr:hypothetical protein JTB14_021934 [Gonioctena quinquepunctata]